MKDNEYNELLENIFEFCNDNLIKPEQVSTLMNEIMLDILEKYFDSAPGTYVLKKGGKIEKFDKEKLYLSVGYASDAIDEPLTQGDIHNVVNKALSSLQNERVNIIPTYKIKEEILKALSYLKFNDVHDKYIEYAEKY